MIRDMHDSGPARPPAGDKLPPHNLEAEEHVIGAALIDNSVLDDLAPVLKPSDFYREANATVWRAALDLHAAGKPVDAVVLFDELARRGEVAAVGGYEAVSRLADAAPHAANAAYHAEIVRQKAVSRAVVEACNQGLREAYSDGFTAAQLLESAERRLLALAGGGPAGQTVPAREVTPAVRETIRRRVAGEFSGLTTGLNDVDDVLCGLQPETLTYLAGRTSTGKTTLALNVIDHACVAVGRPVLLLSLEMSREEVVERLAVARAGVDGQRVRKGQVGPGEVRALEDALSAVDAAPLFIDGTPSRDMAQIASNARRYKARESIQLLVVDLINHVRGDDGRASRREQIGVISKRLKALARELKIPVVVLAQLNRGPDNREGNRPRLSDLKECGDLEEDADGVILLHRPDYYDPHDRPGEADVIVAKNRNGPTSTVKVTFRKALMRFEDFDPNAGYVPPPADDTLY